MYTINNLDWHCKTVAFQGLAVFSTPSGSATVKVA